MLLSDETVFCCRFLTSTILSLVLCWVWSSLKKEIFKVGSSISSFTWHSEKLIVLVYLQHFRGLSFPTISSVGSNGAIIHYSPEAGTCAELDPDQIYLCDSGAQVCEYPFGLVMILIFGDCICLPPPNSNLWSFKIDGLVLLLLKYLDGTTDITRTVHFGKPTPHEKSSNTAVCELYYVFCIDMIWSEIHN